MTTRAEERSNDFIERVRQLAVAGDTDQAVALVYSLQERQRQIQTLAVLARAPAFALDRALERARDLARDLAGDVDLDRGLALALAHDRGRDLARDLARALARALAGDYALALALNRALELARDRDSGGELALALARDLDRDLIRDLDLALDLARDRSLATNLGETLRQAGSINRVLVLALEGMAGSRTITLEQPAAATGMVLNGINSLTPHTLTAHVAPFLQALAELQQRISEMRGEPFAEAQIRLIAQEARIYVDVAAAGAIDAVCAVLLPWRRQYAKRLIQLEITQRQQVIRQAEAELKEFEARGESGEAQHDPALVLQRQEIERGRQAAERERSELQQAQIDLALAVIARVAPQLTERERVTAVTRLAEPLNLLAHSPLEIALDDE